MTRSLFAADLIDRRDLERAGERGCAGYHRVPTARSIAVGLTP
jgi:hypothetical protein